MTDDMWWAFVAGIDREALIRELPGSVWDRRMREQHKAHVEQVRAEQRKQWEAIPEMRRAAESEELGRARLEAARREAFPLKRDRKVA